MTRPRLLLFAGCLAVSALFFHQLLIGGGILARGDTHDYFYPYWDARNAHFRAGQLPLWSNELFMGIPLLANPQLGTFYPLNWLTAPLRAPAAISLSIWLHTALAAAGAACLYRQAVSKRWLPACAAALVYGFGGYLGAHVEQINQLQGLAWLPIVFALAHRLLTGASPRMSGLLLALALALQIFSGHTQTVFVSGLGLAVFALALAAKQRRRPRALLEFARRLLMLLAAGGGALLLALPQLLPSLELLLLSNRGGGFSAEAAGAFSLPPGALGRAFLPGYDGQLFGEYIAYIGLIGLGLALWALLARPLNDRDRWIWLCLALVGLALALGRYNPLYPLLSQLPGFTFFRVPARFLALVSLALALLAGLGLEALEPLAAPPRQRQRRILLVALALGALIAATRFLLIADPSLIFGDSAISDRSLLLWLGSGLLALLLIGRRGRWLPPLALLLLGAELFLASQNLPYNDVAPPDVYLEQRFTISQLRAYQAETLVPGRTLSISRMRFDPGDIAALRARFGERGMGYVAQFHALDAVKKGELLQPNLALTWGIPTVDGFGGGLTPSRHWTRLSALLLPPAAQRAVDGRLGARLALEACRGACIPPRRWLQATDTRYIITDKLSDVWHEGIAYDTTLARFWAAVTELPPADALYDEARILHRAPLAGWESTPVPPWNDQLTITDIPGAGAFLRAGADVLAITLVNSRQRELFLQLQPPPFERALSSAVKVYRHGSEDDRAFLVTAAPILPDDAAGDERAQQLLREGAPVVLQGNAEPRAGALDASAAAIITAYTATEVALHVDASAPAYLILLDAHYPGWQATVNGISAPIYRANLVFRAVPVPAGASRVVFRFQPRLWGSALALGGGLWLLAGGIWWHWRRRERSNRAEIPQGFLPPSTPRYTEKK